MRNAIQSTQFILANKSHWCTGGCELFFLFTWRSWRFIGLWTVYRKVQFLLISVFLMIMRIAIFEESMDEDQFLTNMILNSCVISSFPTTFNLPIYYFLPTSTLISQRWLIFSFTLGVSSSRTHFGARNFHFSIFSSFRVSMLLHRVIPLPFLSLLLLSFLFAIERYYANGLWLRVASLPISEISTLC